MEQFLKLDFNINKIVYACLVKAGEGTYTHRNRPSHGLALFLGGKRIFNFDNKKLIVEGNTVVFFPKGSNYKITELEASDCYAINFQFENNIEFEPFSVKIKNQQNYLPQFKNLAKAWKSRNDFYQLKIKSELYSIIYNLLNELKKDYKNKSDSSIQPAIDYINANFLNKHISVPELAWLCGFSEVYLRKMFQKEFFMSPVQYIKKLRLQYAEELLLSGFYKVSDICYMSGFNDESYFSREFKKLYGKSPKEYANEI